MTCLWVPPPSWLLSSGCGPNWVCPFDSVESRTQYSIPNIKFQGTFQPGAFPVFPLFSACFGPKWWLMEREGPGLGQTENIFIFGWLILKVKTVFCLFSAFAPNRYPSPLIWTVYIQPCYQWLAFPFLSHCPSWTGKLAWKSKFQFCNFILLQPFVTVSTPAPTKNDKSWVLWHHNS